MLQFRFEKLQIKYKGKLIKYATETSPSVSLTCFPEFPVPEHGHDDQQVPDNIHHDGGDEDAGQQGDGPGEGLVLLPPRSSSLLSRRRGVPGPGQQQQRAARHGGFMVLQGHELREVPRVDESHRVVVAAEGRCVQHHHALTGEPCVMARG